MDNVIAGLRKKIAPWYKNLKGWRTDRKIVVIESDDWGSIRMPSKSVYNNCIEAGYKVDKIAYERFDSLASEEDLNYLFELLTSFVDYKGNHPVITANVLTTNPDFDKIENSNFQTYHYELITETFKRYPAHGKCFDLWKEGLKKNIFFPQSHGREHLNVSMFMNALQNKDRDVLFGFKHKMPGSITHNLVAGNSYVEALKYNGKKDKEDKLEIVVEGLNLFEKLFGYRSQSFIPPNYIWNPDFDSEMLKNGVKYFQGNQKMKEPQSDGTVRLHNKWIGKTNDYGQIYLVRNALFEPSLFDNKISKPVEHCLHQVQVAFKMKKPAVICSHRLNYVGFLDKKNRDNTLKMMKELLTEILGKWPNVEFMTSAKLSTLIEKDDHK